MELLQLRYFMAVAQHGNITKAADALYITQPALSRSIARLEADLQIRLFDRSKNRLTLTPAGEIYLSAVKDAFSALDRGLYDARSCAAPLHRQIRVVTAMGAIRDFAAEYQKEHPFTQIQVELANTRAISSALLKENADLGFCLEPLHSAELHSTLLLQRGFCLVAARGSDFYERSSITVQELAGKTLFCSRYGNTKFILDASFARYGVSLNILELDEKELLFEAPVKGLGCAICIPIPALVSNSPMENRIRFIPITGWDVSGNIFAVTRKKDHTAAELFSFIDYCKTHLA